MEGMYLSMHPRAYPKALGVFETLSDLFFINDYAALRVCVVKGECMS